MRARALVSCILLSTLVIIFLSTVAQATEYREVKAEEILKQIEKGEEVNYTSCRIVGELNVSKIKLKTVPNPAFNKLLNQGYTEEEILKSFSLQKNLSVVESNITITNSIFENASIFSNALFNSTSDFSYTIFDSKADFSFATFKDSADFSRAIFESNNFSHAIFDSKADFSYATFKYSANFSKASFNHADFSRAILANADFSYATFKDSAYFSKATFDYSHEALYIPSSFSYATFKNYADFSRTIFYSNAVFSHVIFDSKADFSFTTFKNYADFSYATFKNSADFSRTIFYGTAVFSHVIFDSNADFSNASFGDPHFSHVTSITVANFSYVTFKNLANFSSVTFEDSSHLIPPDSPENIKTDHITCKVFMESYNKAERYESADIINYNYQKNLQKNGSLTSVSKWEDILNWGIWGYGTKPSHIFCIAVIFIIVFAIIYKNPGLYLVNNKRKKIPFRFYWRIPGIYKKDENEEKPKVSFWESLYFSIYVFTRLGSADWDSRDNFRKWVALEGFLGWVTIALFISTLINYIIR